jgi:ABC-type uncharacterized transport system permease subunit
MAGTLLLVQRSCRAPAVGVAALPVVAAGLLPGLLAPTVARGHTLAHPLALGVHVATATAGSALFALAAAMALLYLLQERELKTKRFGPLLLRLPSLHALDRANAALVAAGVAVASVALVAGAAVARASWCDRGNWDPQEVAAALAWALFGAAALARRAGSHGRRQAVVTVLCFALAAGGLVAIRQAGLTRHTDLVAQATAAAC